LLALPAIGILFLAACSRSPETAKKAEERASAPVKETPAEPKEANTYKVRFETSKGNFVVEVHPDWAPLGAKRFQELVQAGFYDGARFFRVVPNFVVQFGLASEPRMTKKWDVAIKDDPVKRTNGLGTLAFATMGKDTRTSQVFINLRSNQTLDDRGFAPFARVIEGMNVVESLYSGYGERPEQDAITRNGNAYLEKNFPKLDYIKFAKVL
jgi:cyclophilin family peptidyl-prolyl cis-trans isomerase